MPRGAIEINASLPAEIAARPVQYHPVMATLGFEVLRILTLLEVDQASRERLAVLNQHLQQESVVMYAYHPGKTDVLTMPVVLRRLLPQLKILLGPVAISHYHGLERRILDWSCNQTGTLPLPIVRERDLGRLAVTTPAAETPPSPETLKSRLDKLLLEKTRQHLAQPGNILGIAPGGTRSRQLSQEEINPGFLGIARRSATQLVPAAIYYDRGRLKLRMGELLPPPTKSDNLSDPAVVAPYLAALQQLLPADRR